MCNTSQNAFNHTLEIDETCYFSFKAAFHIPALTLAILVISINLAVILLFKRSRNLRKLPSNVIFLSFAINDLLSGFTIIFHILPYLHFKIIGCTIQNVTKQDKFLNFMAVSLLMSMFTILSAVGHFIMLSTDRILALFYALRYFTIVTRKRTILAVVLVWMSSTFLVLLDLIWWNETDKLPHNKVYTCILLIAFVLFPFIVLSIQYVSVITLVNNLSKHTPSRQTAGFCQARKALITYSLMFSCFVMLSTPFFIMRVIIVFHSTLFNSISVTVFEAIYILRYVTSFINPVLYTLRKRDFRKALEETIVNSVPFLTRSKKKEDIMLLDIKA
ncbi:melanocyte-stimulating hormone receptor-like [Hydractinia symbiolongicarpus]|uniref:melanocyte-stimulating hormone receptor-like n=1 Tax=Hydractinia symbiolongicarpus TaxID=13093 RepID=UPI00254B4A06|nr:melanocyte-stimulating hormone receptor-like [Hydractinia symbiolongicarpus]